MAADPSAFTEDALVAPPEMGVPRVQAPCRLDAEVAEAAHMAGWELDILTRTLRWSTEAFHIHGLPLDQTPSLGRALHFFPTPGRAVLQQAIDDSCAVAMPFDLTLPFVTARGEKKWVRVIAIIKMDNSQVPYLAGAYQDVTTARQLQERLQRTIRGTQDAVWEQDLQTDEMWISERFRQLLGHDESTLPASPDLFEQLLHPADKESFAAERSAHLISEVPFDMEVRLRTREGGYKWVGIRAAAQSAGFGTTATLSGSIRDLTRARAAEEALICAREAAAEAARVKGAFLANMSHEIRTPMNGVLGMTDLLLDTSLTASQRDLAETIRSSGKSLLRILNDVLDFSKIEAGKLEIEAVPFDLHRCLGDVARILQPQAQAKSIELQVEIDPAAPRYVIGDCSRLRQILMNLCGNAIKFTSQGEVHVAIYRIAASPDPHVGFEIRDTGIGMSEDALSRLFNPFTQADVSITRDYGGTGLGLSIVHRLVSLMGGHIEVESELGFGSRFTVTLPLQHAPTPASSSTEVVARGHFNGRVLVVEDNEINQKIASRFLTRLGCEVSIASDGLAGLEAWTKEHFDLVLMDVQMPVMDGLSATAEIRRRTGLRPRTPIVALTAAAMTGDLQRCLDAGMDAMLPKPLEAARLEQVLEQFGLRRLD